MDQKPVCQGSYRALNQYIPTIYQGLDHFSFSPNWCTPSFEVWFIFVFLFSVMCHMEPLVCHQRTRLSKFWGSSGTGINGQGRKACRCSRPSFRVPALVTAGVTVHPLHCSLRRSWSGTPGGLRPHESEQKRQQPQRCGRADESETGGKKKKKRGRWRNPCIIKSLLMILKITYAEQRARNGCDRAQIRDVHSSWDIH